jgi:hypothetical protein
MSHDRLSGLLTLLKGRMLSYPNPIRRIQPGLDGRDPRGDKSASLEPLYYRNAGAARGFLPRRNKNIYLLTALILASEWR